MNLHDLVSQLIFDTKGEAAGLLNIAPNSSLGIFMPEVILCAAIVAMLLIRLFKIGERLDMFYVAFAGGLLALFVLAPWKLVGDSAPIERTEIFTGMLVYDSFSVFMRGVLIGFAVLFVVFTKLSGMPDREDSADVYTLVLGATLGLCLMSTANHLLMVFMGIEMASVPSYAMAGLLKNKRDSSEAALKFAIYGAGSAGVMLYGISLLAGLCNTVHLPTLAIQLSERLPEMPPHELMVVALAGLMVAVGMAYKLSAFPFHYWAPDVFEGASAEIGAFLSVSSKAAALALLVRLAIGVGTLGPTSVASVPPEPDAAVLQGEADTFEADTVQPQAGATGDATYLAAHQGAESGNATREQDAAVTAVAADDGLEGSRGFMGRLVALLAILTCTFGNLAAYGQANIKRLLAYSTIAHAGFMMMAVPPLMATAGSHPDIARSAVSGLAVYILIYLFMNLGAFAIVAFLRNAMGSEQINDYAGLLYRTPGLAICMVLILFSLIGLPPLAGFVAKFAILAAVTDAYRVTGDTFLLVVLVVGVVNTAISLVYYLRVARVITMLPEPDNRAPFQFSMVSLPGAYILAITLPTVVLIVGWDGLHRLALAAASQLLS